MWAQPLLQGTNYDRTFEGGFLHQIPRRITTLHVVPIMKEQLHGFSGVVFSVNGRPLIHFSGFMVNVCSPQFSQGHHLMEFIFKAGSGKSVIWSVDPRLSLLEFTHVFC